MTTIPTTWLQYAMADFDAAERLFQSPKPTRWTYLLVLWHCHQTVEKGLKAVMVGRGQEILKIHDLPRLSHLAKIALDKKKKAFLENLNVYYLQSRYPDLMYPPLPNPDKASTERLLKETKQFFLWLEKQ